ncbi:M48 family metallopeptidase [Flavobacterium yafengii]|uniref:M48 family metallopeptidase n=1 Tax=Flavobacterium yafengii TaxID=3041253 RepID=UPI0024A9AB07|nr:M48 family metallopeptidase [Flavobacterium yafengii]MDI6047755.1 M48 family metallopeptidase [Flavobacterium yafengii]
MKTKLLLFLLLSYFGTCQSQNYEFSYSPNSIDSLENYLTKITNNKINEFGTNQRKKAKEILLERKVSFLKDVEDSIFIFDKTINGFLQKILTEVYHSNPQIDTKDFYFLINKSLIPNAACYGNGIFSINLGLFSLIENNDEMAFIICHELAHYILKHNDKALEEYLETFNSKDVKQQLNTASNKKYGRRSAVTLLLKDLKFNFMKRSRSAETQADSLGFTMFNNTKYNKQASINILKKLDMTDGILFNNLTDLKQNFTFEEYPFKEVWIEKEDKMFDTTESVNDLELDKDSLKTHPNIPLRIENLIHNYTITTTNTTKNEIELVQKKTSENSIKIFFDDSKLDFALYQLLSLHKKNELDKKAFNSYVAYLLKKVYVLKEKHVFGKYVGPVNSFSEEKYINEIRLFLNNLELKDLRKIGYYFCQKNELISKDDTEFQDAYTFFKSLNKN